MYQLLTTLLLLSTVFLACNNHESQTIRNLETIELDSIQVTKEKNKPIILNNPILGYSLIFDSIPYNITLHSVSYARNVSTIEFTTEKDIIPFSRYNFFFDLGIIKKDNKSSLSYLKENILKKDSLAIKGLTDGDTIIFKKSNSPTSLPEWAVLGVAEDLIWFITIDSLLYQDTACNKLILQNLLGSMQIKESAKYKGDTLKFYNSFIDKDIKFNFGKREYELLSDSLFNRIRFKDSILGSVDLYYDLKPMDGFEYPPYSMTLDSFQTLIAQNTTHSFHGERTFNRITIDNKDVLFYTQETEWSEQAMLYYMTQEISICIALEPFIKPIKFPSRDSFFTYSKNVYSDILMSFSIEGTY